MRSFGQERKREEQSCSGGGGSGLAAGLLKVREEKLSCKEPMVHKPAMDCKNRILDHARRFGHYLKNVLEHLRLAKVCRAYDFTYVFVFLLLLSKEKKCFRNTYQVSVFSYTC